jgi:hypothetical protein
MAFIMTTALQVALRDAITAEWTDNDGEFRDQLLAELDRCPVGAVIEDPNEDDDTDPRNDVCVGASMYYHGLMHLAGREAR